MPSNPGKSKQTLFVSIFFLSGVAGLAYQVVWAKSFAAAIGHEYPAMLAVVTAFMGGIALGSVLLGRLRRIPPTAYAWLEIVIGLWAIATLFLISPLQNLVFEILGTTPSPALHWIVVFCAVLLALFPATAAMGATLPAAERFLAGQCSGRARLLPSFSHTGLLYGANTAGAMLGALLGAFWLMPAFGLRNSVFILAALNISCGLAALALARKSPVAQSNPRAKAPLPLAARLFLAGLLGIGFEVVLVRALSHVLENTVYTFAVILAVYLAGTALGAFAFHRAQKHPAFAKGARLFAILGIACALSAILIRFAPTAYPTFRRSIGDSIPAVALSESLIALAVFFAPAFCMVANWAWLAQSSLTFKPNLAWAVAINTAGAALAPLLVGLLLVPVLGLKITFALIAIAYVLLGGSDKFTALALLLAAAAIPFMTSTRHLIDTAGGQIISLQEGVIGSVAIVEFPDRSRVLTFNNRFQMGGTAARIAEQRQAHIPLLLHPGPRRALFIGLGTGITFATAAHYPNLQADGVELVPEIAQAMPLFDQSALASTNLTTYIADGRRFVHAITNLYDVIIADLFHPAQDGAGFLYTREHFLAIHDRLTTGGLFCQWLPLHQIDLPTLEIISRTFKSVFPDGHRWLLRFDINTPVIGLLAFKKTPGYQFARVESLRDSHSELAEHLRAAGLTDSIRLFGCYLGEINARPQQTALNTDPNPIVVFTAPAVTFQRHDNPAQRLIDLIDSAQATAASPPWSRSNPANVTNRVNPANSLNSAHSANATNTNSTHRQIDQFILARNIYLRGLFHQSRGDHDSALKAFLQSAATSPDFTAGYAHALGIATALSRTNPAAARAILESLIRAQPEIPVARQLLDRL